MLPDPEVGMSEVKCRILCVDDHEDTPEMLRLLLSESDYEVHPAYSVEEAMQLAAMHQFDLYVLDKRLPDGTGMELFTRLNQLTPGVPCIFAVTRANMMGVTRFIPWRLWPQGPTPMCPSPMSKPSSRPFIKCFLSESAPRLSQLINFDGRSQFGVEFKR